MLGVPLNRFDRVQEVEHAVAPLTSLVLGPASRPRRLRNKTVRNAYMRAYLKRPEAHLKRRERVRRNRLVARAAAHNYITTHFIAHPCVDCGEPDPIVLEFDHVRGVKLTTISLLVSRGHPLRAIILEIEKCEVRCCNCHRRVTYLRRKQATPRAA